MYIDLMTTVKYTTQLLLLLLLCISGRNGVKDGEGIFMALYS